MVHYSKSMLNQRDVVVDYAEFWWTMVKAGKSIFRFTYLSNFVDIIGYSWLLLLSSLKWEIMGQYGNKDDAR